MPLKKIIVFINYVEIRYIYIYNIKEHKGNYRMFDFRGGSCSERHTRNTRNNVNEINWLTPARHDQTPARVGTRVGIIELFEVLHNVTFRSTPFVVTLDELTN